MALSASLLFSGTAGASEWKERPLNVVDDKYRNYYEVFVYSYYDSDGDGIGDLNGLREKLDYLNDGDDTTTTDLGVNGIWLMPVMPSPTYHKYDTTDYMGIDPQYGTMEDFQALIEECHDRGIRVIIDLALNHSSSEHPWFQEATAYLASLPEGAEPDLEACPYVDYYHFSNESVAGYTQVPGTENWYYESKFWSGMPDLNLESEAVRAEFEAIADYWLGLGVDGFRLDAVKEYVSDNATANIEILSWFNDYVKTGYPDAYLVCECWTERETYAQYYESGVDSMFAFHFGDSTGAVANLVRGVMQAASYGNSLEKSYGIYESYKEDFIDAPFYVNHDTGRSAGFYAGDTAEAQTKMGNALNLLMSGSTFLYYGEELGMKGSGIDENKRAPMQWSQDAEAEGMCEGPEAMEEIEMTYGSLEEQAEDPNSIYNYVKDVLLLKNQNPAIARGTLTNYRDYSTDWISVISKSYEDTELLMLFNISKEESSVDLTDLNIQGKAVSELSVLGELLTGETETSMEGNIVTMPAYSVLVMGVEE